MVPTHGLAIAQAGPQDASGILQLVNRVQPHLPWTPEHLQWQYFSTPAGPANLYVVRDGPEIVSLYAAVAQRIRADRRLARARMAQDVITHPDYRGRGLLHQLAARCFEDLRRFQEVGYTFPNEASEKSFRRTGWRELTVVPSWRRGLSGPVPSPGGTRFLRLDQAFPPAATRIWEDAGLAAGVHRDVAFLNWRYCHKPAARYHRYLIGEEEGVLVFKFFRGNDSLLAHLCDLFVRQESRGLAAEALRFFLRASQREGAQTATAWLPQGHPYEQALAAEGFEWAPRDSRFVFVTAPPELLPAVGDPRNWHLTQGDSDVY